MLITDILPHSISPAWEEMVDSKTSIRNNYGVAIANFGKEVIFEVNPTPAFKTS